MSKPKTAPVRCSSAPLATSILPMNTSITMATTCSMWPRSTNPSTDFLTDSISLNTNSPHHDGELPESADCGENYDVLGYGPVSGTSYDCAAVSGIAALIQDASPSLMYPPYAARAV